MAHAAHSAIEFHSDFVVESPTHVQDQALASGLRAGDEAAALSRCDDEAPRRFALEAVESDIEFGEDRGRQRVVASLR